MKIVIAGGGKIGYYTAKTLVENGNDVALIECRRELCQKIANELDIPVYHGDGTTVEALMLAGIAEADVFVSVTGQDEDNLVAAQLAKKRFGVEKVIARANNPKNLNTIKELGADIAVSSTQIITDLIQMEVESRDLRLLATLNKGEAGIHELTVPKKWSLDGIFLKDIPLPKGCVIIAKVQGRKMEIPRGDTTINSGDHLTAVVHKRQIKDFLKVFTEE